VPIAALAKALALKELVERGPFSLARRFADSLHKILIERADEGVQPSPVFIWRFNHRYSLLVKPAQAGIHGRGLRRDDNERNPNSPATFNAWSDDALILGSD
jgi:hypothetical protein